MAEIAKRLARKALKDVANIVQPETILGWHRRSIAKKFDGSKNGAPGKGASTAKEIEDLVVQLARDNRGWGYRRIAGALSNLGHIVSHQTVANFLKRHNIALAPGRHKTMSWQQFIRSHLEVLASVDSIAWGDYDNDSQLDFLVAGTIEGGAVSQLWYNTLQSSNSPPAAPTGLSATVSSKTADLNWDSLAEDHTPAAGLSYNVRIGTTPGASDIVSAPALTNGVLLTARMGSARNGSAVFHQLKPGRAYYWSVQAVDSSLAGSPFDAEQRFNTELRLINPVTRANGVFEFGFIATPGAIFTAVAATNLSLGLTNWTVLGAITEISPGKFQFTDADATNNPRRFYRVRSP